MAEKSQTAQWIVGLLVVTFLGLISFIWVDREGRLTDLERRVEIREQEWHRARYALQDKIHELEYEIKTLKGRLPPVRQE